MFKQRKPSSFHLYGIPWFQSKELRIKHRFKKNYIIQNVQNVIDTLSALTLLYINDIRMPLNVVRSMYQYYNVPV